MTPETVGGRAPPPCKRLRPAAAPFPRPNVACPDPSFRLCRDVESCDQSKQMASNRPAADQFDEDEDVVDRPRPRRRFRGLHWRHASQTYTPPPPQQTQPQYSSPQLRPLSLSLGQSGFDGLETIHSPHAAAASAAAVISPETPPSAGSYSYNPLRRCINGLAHCQRVLQMS
jgi:hypothetical protein